MPVAYSPNDRNFYFNKGGATLAVGTIEEPMAGRYARDGDEVVQRICTQH